MMWWASANKTKNVKALDLTFYVLRFTFLGLGERYNGIDVFWYHAAGGVRFFVP